MTSYVLVYKENGIRKANTEKVIRHFREQEGEEVFELNVHVGSTFYFQFRFLYQDFINSISNYSTH